jgi:hypothetical protein
MKRENNISRHGVKITVIADFRIVCNIYFFLGRKGEQNIQETAQRRIVGDLELKCKRDIDLWMGECKYGRGIGIKLTTSQRKKDHEGRGEGNTLI